MCNQKKEWEESYQNKQNFLFYPHEEVVRFISKFVRKRTGLKDFNVDFMVPPKILDLGCGIGRHIVFANQMGLEPYGIDLSSHAVEIARAWGKEEGISDIDDRVIQGDTQCLPWNNCFFDSIISHGVLDSMHFVIAKKVVEEVYRVLKPAGLFYCDLVSGDDSNHYREYCGEKVVQGPHEQGTIQSYFNHAKILELFGETFEIVEGCLIRRENIAFPGYLSRYHLVLRRI